MPEVISKYPDVTLKILKEAGAAVRGRRGAGRPDRKVVGRAEEKTAAGGGGWRATVCGSLPG